MDVACRLYLYVLPYLLKFRYSKYAYYICLYAYFTINLTFYTLHSTSKKYKVHSKKQKDVIYYYYLDTLDNRSMHIYNIVILYVYNYLL